MIETSFMILTSGLFRTFENSEVWTSIEIPFKLDLYLFNLFEKTEYLKKSAIIVFWEDMDFFYDKNQATPIVNEIYYLMKILMDIIEGLYELNIYENFTLNIVLLIQKNIDIEFVNKFSKEHFTDVTNEKVIAPFLEKLKSLLKKMNLVNDFELLNEDKRDPIKKKNEERKISNEKNDQNENVCEPTHEEKNNAIDNELKEKDDKINSKQNLEEKKVIKNKTKFILRKI